MLSHSEEGKADEESVKKVSPLVTFGLATSIIALVMSFGHMSSGASVEDDGWRTRLGSDRTNSNRPDYVIQSSLSLPPACLAGFMTCASEMDPTLSNHAL